MSILQPVPPRPKLPSIREAVPEINFCLKVQPQGIAQPLTEQKSLALTGPAHLRLPSPSTTLRYDKPTLPSWSGVHPPQSSAQISTSTLHQNIRFNAIDRIEETKPRKRGVLSDETQKLVEWLAVHGKHAYPTKDEMQELEKQTRLQRSQIKNWIMRARRQDQKKSAKRRYQCIYPGCKTLPFRYQSHLKDHMIVHSDDRPYSCSIKGCPRGREGNGFKKEMELTRHSTTRHSKTRHFGSRAPTRMQRALARIQRAPKLMPRTPTLMPR